MSVKGGTKEELADLLRHFPTWGHAALHYKAENDRLLNLLEEWRMPGEVSDGLKRRTDRALERQS